MSDFETRKAKILSMPASMSAGQIAAEIGCTKNAVIGIRWRNGVKSTFKFRPDPTSKPKAKSRQLVPQSQERGMRVLSDVGFVVADAVMALQANQCRFPIGDPRTDDFRFCGKDRLFKRMSNGDVRFLPYCRTCSALVYVPVRTAA